MAAHRFSRWLRLQFVPILFVALAIVTMWAAAPLAVAAPLDPQVVADLAASPDGQASFALYFGPPPDLSGAGAITDWAIRGQFVTDRLQTAANAAQTPVLNRLARRTVRGRITSYQSLWIANAIIVRGDRVAAEALARELGVGAILPEMKLDPLPPPENEPAALAASFAPAVVEWGVQKIGAPTVWTAPYNATGQGIVVGVVDTGVVWEHTALKSHYRGWDSGTGTVNHDYSWFNPDPAATCDDSASGTCDWHGHGTHVTGTTVGDDAIGNQIGVAPGAKWIHALGCCPDNAALLAALQWMLAPTDRNGNAPDPGKRPQVINNSWGGPGGSRIFYDAIANLVAAGIVPVFSAGNNGPSCGTPGSPADNLPAFSVGATDSTDTIANLSSRGSNPFSGQTAPDVTAPGVLVRSSTYLGGFGNKNGTSMAAPHVAGAVALLLSAEPELIGQVAQIEEVLRRTATPLTSTQTCGGVPGSQTPNSTYGWGRIDVAAAVNQVWQAGTLSGVVTAAATGNPIAGATVSITRDGVTRSQQTAADGGYSFVAGAGIYQVTAVAFGYAEQSAPGSVVSQDAVTTQDLALGSLTLGSITGTVVENSTTTPVLGAEVVLVGTTISTTTAADGAYTLSSVPLGVYTARLTAAGYQYLSAAVTVTGAEVQDFRPNPTPDYLVGDGGDTCSAVYDWIDATSGTAYNLGDDAYVSVVLPWPFTFYGNVYSTVHISSNGFISFGAGYDKWHGVLPYEGAPNNQIIGLGEDLNPEGGTQGKVYARDLGDGRFVIEYFAVEHWSSGNPETFEIILHRDSGVILAQYHTINWPDFANAGIENADGTRGILYSSANEPPLVAGLAVLYTPFSGAPPICALPVAPVLAIVESGSDVTLAWEHLPPNAAYQVWQATTPYFDPAAGEGTLLETVPASAGTMTRPAAGHIGDPDINDFYLARRWLAGGTSGPSNRVSEFDFALAPGN